MDILSAFALVILTTTTAIWLNAHHARLERHHRGRPSSSECSATVAAMVMLERGGCHGVDIIAANMANHPRIRARGPAVILPSCDLDDMSVAGPWPTRPAASAPICTTPPEGGPRRALGSRGIG